MDDDQRRISALEARVAELEAVVAELRPVPTAAPDMRRSSLQPPPPTGPPLGAPTPSSPPAPAAAPAAPTGRGRPVLDTEAVLKWGGIALVVLAVGFAVNTAIQRGWIGPELQLAGALAIAGALIGVGLRLRPTRMPWAHTLCSGGVAVVFTTFGSSLFIDQTNVDVAHILTFVALLGVLALARFVPSEWTAVVAVVGSLVGWLVISESTGPVFEPHIAFIVGLVVVVAVAIEQRWFGLRFLAWLIALPVVIAFAGTAGDGGDEIATLVGLALVVGTLVSVPSLAPAEGPWRKIEPRLAVVLAPWAGVVLAVLYVDEDSDAGLIALIVTAVVISIAVAVKPRLLTAHFVALLIGASITFTTGVGLVLDADVVWLVVAVQGAGLLVLARVLDDDWLVVFNAALLLVASAAFAAIDGLAAWEIDTGVVADIVRLGVIMAVAAAVWLIGNAEVRRLGAVGILGLVLVWLGSVLVHLPQGQAAVSLSWAVIGVTMLIVGTLRKLPDVGQVALAVLAITVGKLLLVDMAEVDALWRAGLFLAVGLAFLRLGFLLPTWTDVKRSESRPADGPGSR